MRGRLLLSVRHPSSPVQTPPSLVPQVHVFHVAHCDDDGIWMNLNIANLSLAGHAVHLVVHTDMTTDPVYPLLRGLSGSCWWHGVTHTFSTMTAAEFTAARDAEGAANIGHFGGTFHTAAGRPASDSLTRGFSQGVVEAFETAYPGAYHHAMSWVDSQHADHRATGYGLLDAVDAASVAADHATFYLRTEDMDNHAGSYVSTSARSAALAVAGSSEYAFYDPGSNRYGIGYHNAHSWFDPQFASPSAKTHTSSQNR